MVECNGLVEVDLNEPLNPYGTAPEVRQAVFGVNAYDASAWKEHAKQESFLIFITISIAASMYILAMPGGNGSAATIFTLLAGVFGIITSLQLLYVRVASLENIDVDTIEEYRKQANELHETYLVLTETVKELETQVAVMKRSETDLMDIASHQEFTFDEVIDMVIENNMTVEKQKMNFRLIAVYFVAKTFFRGDEDSSLEKLVMHIFHLQCKMKSHGIKVEADMLAELIRKSGTKGLLKFCSKFLFSHQEGQVNECEMKMFTMPEHKQMTMLTSNRSVESKGALSRKVRADLASRLSQNKNITPPFPREITVNF